MMLFDCHAHLDREELSTFLESFKAGKGSHKFEIITNSVDQSSSVRNLQISKEIPSVHPFVGIHPQTFGFAGENGSKFEADHLEKQLERVGKLVKQASGVGEIGIDPKYSQIELQEYLFTKQLEIAEKERKPISIHSRNSVRRILEILDSYSLKKGILFHWFAGSEEELHRIQKKGYFCSFGPALLYSNKLKKLLKVCNSNVIMAETDSPLHVKHIDLLAHCTTPFDVGSVIFSMALNRNTSFESMEELNMENALNFLFDSHTTSNPNEQRDSSRFEPPV